LTIVLSVLRFTDSDYPFDIFKQLTSWSYLCSVSSIEMRVDCSFCWYWWNWWLSLFQIDDYHCFKLMTITVSKG
jgi:hypothetical protein